MRYYNCNYRTSQYILAPHYIVTSVIGSTVITRVCWFFVGSACCDFSKSASPIFVKFGTHVHHHETKTLLISERSRLKFKVKSSNRNSSAALHDIFTKFGRPADIWLRDGNGLSFVTHDPHDP